MECIRKEINKINIVQYDTEGKVRQTFNKVQILYVCSVESRNLDHSIKINFHALINSLKF